MWCFNCTLLEMCWGKCLSTLGKEWNFLIQHVFSQQHLRNTYIFLSHSICWLVFQYCYFLSPQNITLKSTVSKCVSRCGNYFCVKKKRCSFCKKWCVQNGFIFTGRRLTFVLAKCHQHIAHKSQEWFYFCLLFPLSDLIIFFGGPLL